MSLKKYLTEAELAAVQPVTGDEFDISIRELTNIETVVVEHSEGSITIALDETAIQMLEHCGCTFEDEEIEEAGAFAYGKPPRKGTVAYNAANKRKEQEKNSKPIEPKDQMVGNAKVTKEEQVDELAPLIGAIGRAALPIAGRALGTIGGAALSGAGSLAGGALAGTGAAIGGAIKGARNIAKGFEDEDDEQEDDSSNIGKQLALADEYTEEEQVDELAPLKALAGIGAKMVKSPTSKAAGQVVKSVGKAIDKKVFGPRPHEEDYEESIKEQDDEKIEYQPQPGDIVQIDYPSAHEGEYGEVIELSPSGDFVYVEFKNGNIESYHASDLRQATEDEIDQYYHGEKDFEETLNSMRRLSGMPDKQPVKEMSYDKTSGGPYDRGAADSYYGRPPRPHKMMPATNGVQGEMKMVPLTDPKEIAAYEAGYKENDDRKDYGEGIENWDLRVTSIPRTEPFKLKKIVVTSKFGKTYTFDTEDDARRHFGENWDKITDPVWRKANGWNLDMNNTKSEKGLDEGDVIQFKKPALSGDTQNLQAAKKIAKDLYWHASSSYFTDEENAQEEQLHQQLAKMGYSADEDLENQTITITQKSTGKQYRMGEDELLSEAEYRGRKVPLGKPMQGDVGKFKVYVKDPSTGNVKKVNFGDPNMRIRKSNPGARKNFRARHNCKNPGPRTKARYWSCRKW